MGKLASDVVDQKSKDKGKKKEKGSFPTKVIIIIFFFNYL